MLQQSTFWFGMCLVLVGVFGLGLVAVLMWRRG